MVTRIDIHHRRTTQEMGDIVPSTTKRYLPQQHYVTSWSVPIAKNYLSLTQGRLARETLAIKWRGLCDIMLVWYLPYCTSLKHLRMGCSFLVPAIDESNFVPAGKAVSQTPLSAAGRAPLPKTYSGTTQAGSHPSWITLPGGTEGYPAQPGLIRLSVRPSVSPSVRTGLQIRY